MILFGNNSLSPQAERGLKVRSVFMTLMPLILVLLPVETGDKNAYSVFPIKNIML